jgi:hypothetical protein
MRETPTGSLHLRVVKAPGGRPQHPRSHHELRTGEGLRSRLSHTDTAGS